MSPSLEIGYTVTFVNKDQPTAPVQRGRIVGIDPSPPERAKRKGTCYVLRVEGLEGWVYRTEDEILEIEEVI